MTHADQRRKQQLAFLASNEEIEVGKQSDLPLPLSELKTTEPTSAYVEEYFKSGLTAHVYKLNINGRHWTLKKQRHESLVKNIDGQTSFLNEVQRRRDFEALKSLEPDAYKGIVDTTYASLHHGIILSPWIEGKAIDTYTPEIIENLFQTLFHVERAGIFEYDLCSGNLLLQADGQVRLFDFGYMYAYDPLKAYNPDGKENPIFHSAERFETRSFMQYLMDLEEREGAETVLSLYRAEKQAALKIYRQKFAWLHENHAEHDVIRWVENIILLWEHGLADQESLIKLYDLESFRSYVLDIHDDIGGQSCTPDTLKKMTKVLEKLKTNYSFLKKNHGFFWGDEKLSKAQLLKKYLHLQQEVHRFQIPK